MEKQKGYKTKIKKFLGYDVRTVRVDNEHEYIVCKDMFDILGLVDEDGTWTRPKNKMIYFLNGLDKREYLKTLQVLLKQGKTKVAKETICLNIEIAPTVLTQFQPTKRRSEEALNRWFKFMKFVDMLLQYHKVHKYITLDKQDQKDKIASIMDNGGEGVIANQKVNLIMGKLITGEDNFSIRKEELKIYQPQTTRDLLKVRKDVLNMFDVIYGVCKSHKQTYDTVLDIVLKKYSD